MNKKFKHKPYGFCSLDGMGSCVHIQKQDKLENSLTLKNSFKKGFFTITTATNKIISTIYFKND